MSLLATVAIAANLGSNVEEVVIDAETSEKKISRTGWSNLQEYLRDEAFKKDLHFAYFRFLVPGMIVLLIFWIVFGFVVIILRCVKCCKGKNCGHCNTCTNKPLLGCCCCCANGTRSTHCTGCTPGSCTCHTDNKPCELCDYAKCSWWGFIITLVSFIIISIIGQIAALI